MLHNEAFSFSPILYLRNDWFLWVMNIFKILLSTPLHSVKNLNHEIGGYKIFDFCPFEIIKYFISFKHSIFGVSIKIIPQRFNRLLSSDIAI